MEISALLLFQAYDDKDQGICYAPSMAMLSICRRQPSHISAGTTRIAQKKKKVLGVGSSYDKDPDDTGK